MMAFDYVRVRDAAEAARRGAADGQRFLAGGTNLVDLLKQSVERPAGVIDINGLALKSIDDMSDGGLQIGALVTNSATATDPRVVARYPLLASAILSGATAQLRNVATAGGNLNQRTRCVYFNDTAMPCNKRTPGAGCSAIGGVTRMHAILGASDQCIATHPSDMCVALACLEAVVHVHGPDGERKIDIADYHRLPGDDASRDNVLRPGELVTAIELPAESFDRHFTYLKLRDRLSYAFALVSVAVAMQVDGEGRMQQVRVALGGVAHKPWRVPVAEIGLAGEMPSSEIFALAASRLVDGACGQGENDFKIELARRAIVRALHQAAAATPQSQTDKTIR